MGETLETPGRIEPCCLEVVSEEISGLVAMLAARSAKLGARLRPKTAAHLADLVRIVNCYYSNLIEGHDTNPRDIERALGGELAEEAGRRALQVEAAAHVQVQRAVDGMAAAGRLPEPASVDFVRWLHREFYRDVPPDMLHVGNGERPFEMEPGAFRTRPEHDVVVGRHVPPSSERVDDFMRHFESRYRFASMGPDTRIMAMAAAHHRLAYIHPFPDGNGRVARLMSHAMAHAAGVGACGLWPISRGLALGLSSHGEYGRMMDYADTPRQGALDGRGNLSLRALTEFSAWFLRVCVNQVTFMDALVDPDRLRERLRAYVERDERLRPEAGLILNEVLSTGEMVRGDTARVTGLTEQAAGDLLGTLTDDGILASDTTMGPVSFRFTVHVAEILLPGLLPQA
ncbi:Fic family protein [Azospirillum argentinense]|uniref:Fic family protein n=1 Tax=Azospirillum argentinense TaxID=2970906 RepID=A0ABW8VGA0_9PROT